MKKKKFKSFIEWILAVKEAQTGGRIDERLIEIKNSLNYSPFKKIRERRKEMNIKEMTIKDFEKIKHRKKWNEEIECESLIILPSREEDELHESGFRCIDFIAVEDEKPLCRLSGCSDVIHIDGIGGLGYDWAKKYNGVPSLVPISGWSIDCLPKSGLLRIWPRSHKMRCGAGLSSFEIFAIE